MDVESAKASPHVKDIDLEASIPVDNTNTNNNTSSTFSASSLTTWAKSLKLPQPLGADSSETTAKSSFSRLTTGLGLRLSPKASEQTDNSGETSITPQAGFIGTLTKGFVDTSKSAVKAVQVKARHAVSQNKRRYQVRCLCYRIYAFYLVSKSWY